MCTLGKSLPFRVTFSARADAGVVLAGGQSQCTQDHCGPDGKPVREGGSWPTVTRRRHAKTISVESPARKGICRSLLLLQIRMGQI